MTFQTMWARKARITLPLQQLPAPRNGTFMRALRAHQEKPQVRALCLERTQDVGLPSVQSEQGSRRLSPLMRITHKLNPAGSHLIRAWTSGTRPRAPPVGPARRRHGVTPSEPLSAPYRWFASSRRPSIGTPSRRPGDWSKNAGSNVRMAEDNRLEDARHRPEPRGWSSNAR